MAFTPIPNLKRLRLERKLTQEQVATTLGITTRTLIRWEACQGEPGLSELVALARFYEVTLDELVGELKPAAPLPNASGVAD